MIIRMTVNDNDFTDLIEKFSKNLLQLLLFGDDQEFDRIQDSGNIDEQFEFMKHNLTISELMNPNNDKNLTLEQRAIICEDVRKHWKKFVESPASRINHETEGDASEYLISHFQVAIWYRMIDHFENGEVVYFFTTNDKFITH